MAVEIEPWMQDYFLGLLKAAAPEKGPAVEEIVKQRGIVFAVDPDSERVTFSARGGERPQITIGARCVGRLWAHAFAYFCIYTEVANELANNLDVREFNLRTNERRRISREMLAWAVNNEIRIRLAGNGSYETESLPEGLPEPFAPSEKKSDEDMADELCLMALGFILHHELAHIVRGHEYTQGYVSILQEKEADRDAATVLLDSQGLASDKRLFRFLGMSVGLSWLTSHNVYIRHRSSTHPPGYDRLYQTLEHFESDDDSVAWAFVLVALQLHLFARNMDVASTREYTSFKSAVNDLVDAISRIETIRPDDS